MQAGIPNRWPYIRFNFYVSSVFVTHRYERRPGENDTMMLAENFTSSKNKTKKKHFGRNRLCFIYFNNCSYIQTYTRMCVCRHVSACACVWVMSGCCACMAFYDLYAIKICIKFYRSLMVMAKLIFVIWYALLKMATER